MKTGTWSDDEKEFLRSNYIENGSVYVGKKLDRNPRSVSCMARYLGLRRGWGEPRWRAYTINRDFFKSWSCDSAYLVGLILTDGNLVERELSIVSKDTELLEKARDAMSSRHPIQRCGKNKDVFRIRIGNKSMIADLKSIGISENKSKTVTLPDIPDGVFFDFLRGYLDGDGMLKHTPGKVFILKLTTGSPFILDDVSNTITRLLGIDRHAPQARTQNRRGTISTWYELTYCGMCAAKICEAMYEHSGDLFLSRKHQAFTNYTNRPKDQGLRHNGGATKYR